MREFLQMIMWDIPGHFVQRFHDMPVKNCATLMEQRPIGYLGSKGMFERILHFWKQTSFIEEFSCLEMRDVAAKVILWQLCHSTQQG